MYLVLEVSTKFLILTDTLVYYYGHVLRARRGSYHPPPSTAEVRNELSYSTTPPVCLHGMFCRALYLCILSALFNHSVNY